MTPALAQLAAADSARVVQLSDTHVAAAGVAPPLASLLEWIAGDPPDLLVLTGDLVYHDPDAADDRSFVRSVFGRLPCPWVAIPGNHDVGFYGECTAARRAAFIDAWGGDRFAVDVAGWRLVGVNAYTLGDAEADAWVAASLAGASDVALFIHQPVAAEPVDGWEMPASALARLESLVAGAPVRLVAAGHRHCALVRGRPGDGIAGDAVHVWAPSTTFVGLKPYHGGDPSPGAVEYRFSTGGSLAHRFVPAITDPPAQPPEV